MDENLKKYFQRGGAVIAREYNKQQKPVKEEVNVEKIEEPEIEYSGISEFTLERTQTSSEKEVLFKDMKIHPHLLKALQKLQFVTTKQVQADTFSFFADGTWESLKIFAPRKCGKTTAVLLCIFNDLLMNAAAKSNQALILCPTHELIDMCYSDAQQLAEFCQLTFCIPGKGKSLNKSKKITENIIIATPAKALEMVPSLDFKNITFLFFDDAVCLKNSASQFNSFSRLCEKVPIKHRIIITTESSESQILEDFFRESKRLWFKIERKDVADIKNVKQVYVVCSASNEKLNAITHFTLKTRGQTVIFCETSEGVVELEAILKANNILAVKLFGGASPNSRKEILKQFKDQKIKILITTEAFLRVLPSDHITLVINFDQLFQKDGLLLDEYEKRRFLLNESGGTFVSLVDERYKNFFFKGKTFVDGSYFYKGAEIVTVENLKKVPLQN